MSVSDPYDHYTFTSNLTDYACPKFRTARCRPPAACANNSQNGRPYCCDTKVKESPTMGRVCWSLGSECKTDGSTFTCGDGDIDWCCQSKTEKCSLTKGQSNICWANARNTLQHVDVSVLNDTYLSLSSAKPRESSWTFDPVTLIVATQTSSMFFIPSTSSPSASVPTTTPPNASDLPNSSLSVSVSTTPPPNASAVPNTSSTSSPGSSTHISGGAIGGIVVGTVAVIAIGVGLGVGFLKKRNKQKVEMSEEPFFKDDGEVKAELSSRKPLQELSAETHPQELGPGYEVAELEAGK